MNTTQKYHMPEFPTTNAITRPEINGGETQVVNTGYVHVYVPVNTMKSISGFLLADRVRKSWESSEKVYLEETGCCE